ncbi:hypothetical protein NYZ99_16525 [Maribacter litopenaei]|uniref:Uncharacterized protein n=1 Tax=Maribacter litopenaei TaxID=2976127 RepID=A0ABY5Y6I8_9FLAO|nr:hypothetical protein [Maribacter litopenaei]UWX54499.1 hypothetical protein NYZ99_16525 [Maribacter litopenaei]
MDTTIELADGFEISRVVTGLWQIADMERHGTTLDPVETAKYMQPYLGCWTNFLRHGRPLRLQRNHCGYF